MTELAHQQYSVTLIQLFFRIQQNSFAVPLMEVLLDIVEEKVSLQTQLNSLVLEARAGR